MNILLTGCCGFIGSNFINNVSKNYPDYSWINIDSLRYKGTYRTNRELNFEIDYCFIKGEINNTELITYILNKHKISHIINFAAETHVDRSIVNPSKFVETNVNGTLNLLNAARECNIEKFIQISTDEVYGSLGRECYFTEESPIQPNSPYSASKASADLLVRSYHETYGLDVNIIRCSNNYGPYQHPEKLIPLMVTNALEGRKLPIYGDGNNIRDWLHVEDHCRAIDLVLHNGEPGEVYNVGANNERTNNEIVDIIVNHLGVSRDLIQYVDDRLGHDRRYAVDASKIKSELGWEPKRSFEEGIIETIDWYKNNESWWKPLKEKL